jgi:hypothetical protein
LAVEDALPGAGSGEPRATAFDPAPSSPTSFHPTVVLSAAASFVVLLLAAEGASRLAVRTGFWYSRFDVAGAVTSLPELEDRVAWAASRPRPLFVLGDSVLGASALLEHGAASPRKSTLAARLAEREAVRGSHVESLAADGMLLDDLEAESRVLSDATSRGRVLVVLNFRMFASEFLDARKSRSREFLAPQLHPSLETALPERAVRASALLRTSSMLQSLWYFPTRRDFFRRVAERVLGGDSDPEIQEAALRLKVAPYYRDRWKLGSPPFAALASILRDLAAAGPVAVVLTPQNPDFVEDTKLFAANRADLAEFLRGQGTTAHLVEYRDWADKYPSERFLDHCHLTAEGNREYAAELARWIDP